MKSFTLIELLVSVTIFIFVIFALQGFLSSVFSTQFRAIAMKKLADNTRGALEIMGREMRLAKEVGSGCTLTGASFEIINGGKGIKFIDFDGRCITYTFSPPIFTKAIGVSGSSQTFLGGDVKVNDVTFLLISALNQQPRVVMRIDVQTNDPTAPNQALRLETQTTVSRREIE